MASGNGNERGTRLESRFANGVYKGYEVRLLVERAAQYEPYPLKTGSDIYRFMQDLSRESAEHVYELLMDAKHRVTGVYLAGKGGIDQSPVMPMELYKTALLTNSPAFILCHNHPSGVPEPSPDDLNLAQRIRQGADILGLEFTDFVIIGNGSYCSFLERGLTPIRRC